MDQLSIYVLGFLGQALFGSRLIIQLIWSEKKGKVVSPTIFWQLSLAGSFIFLIYGILRNDPVIIFGQFLSYFIYIRNLQLKKEWIKIYRPFRYLVLALPFFLIFYASILGGSTMNFPSLTNPVMLLGVIGQLALNLRFVYQWYYSERHKTSILPVGFWQISTWASVLVIIYSLFHPTHGIDIVLLVSQSLGIFVYIRNIFIFRKNRVSKNLKPEIVV